MSFFKPLRQNLFQIVLFAAACTALHPLTVLAKQPQEKENILGIEVRGSAGFLKRTHESLELLEPTRGFQEIRPYIAVIQESKRSGMRAQYERPTYEVGKATWQHSALWYAGTIVHDGYHSKLYHDAKASRFGSEPELLTWSGAEAEKKCLDAQERVLRELNAPASTIEYIRKWAENPTYQGDPASSSDYQKRWW